MYVYTKGNVIIMSSCAATRDQLEDFDRTPYIFLMVGGNGVLKANPRK